MSGVRGIDLQRMPALAHSIEAPPILADVFEVMRIAAGARAARFYLQQVLLRPNAIPTAFLACHRALRANWSKCEEGKKGQRRRSPLRERAPYYFGYRRSQRGSICQWIVKTFGVLTA